MEASMHASLHGSLGQSYSTLSTIFQLIFLYTCKSHHIPLHPIPFMALYKYPSSDPHPLPPSMSLGGSMEEGALLLETESSSTATFILVLSTLVATCGSYTFGNGVSN
jgi:hypothetical protein